ncbi:Uncharacterized protein (Fragment) [Durusdinium trenchii]|uniref:Uncharacterized protein n=1 Tax=Durusdinium trenchii TaxID=1381693 RepID=A0ABP0JI39_9DINO
MASQMAEDVLDGFELQCAKPLGNLPRFGPKLGAVAEPDWSKLPPLLATCENDTASICFKDDLLLGQGGDFDPMDLLNGESTGWHGVLQSYAGYGGLSAALAVVSFLFLLCFFLYKLLRCCCKCCCSSKSKQQDQQEEGGAKSSGRCGSVAVQGCAVLMLLFLFCFVLSFCFVGNAKGNNALPEAVKDIGTTVPLGTATMVLSLPAVAENMITRLSGTTFVSMIGTLNSTLTSAVDFTIVKAAIGCVESTMDKFGPSTIAGFLDMIDDVETATGLFPDLSVTLTQIETLSNQTAALDPELAGVKTFILGLKATLQTIDLTPVGTSLTTLNTTLQGDLLPAMQSLEGTLTTMDSNIPASSDITGVADDLAAFRDGPSNTNADAVLASLAALRADLAALPEGVAADVENVQALFDQAVVDLTALQTTFESAKTAVEGVPNATEVDGTLDPLSTLLGGIDLVSIKTTLESLGVAIAALPTSFTTQVDEIKTIQDDIPCIMKLKFEFISLNETLIRLPADFDFVVEALDGINDTVADSMSQIDAMSAQLESVDNTLNTLPNTTEFIELIEELEAKLSSAITMLASVSTEVQAVDTVRGSIDLEDMILSIATLRSNLGAGNPVRIDQSQLDELRGLDNSTAAAVANIDTAASLVQDWKDNFGSSGDAGVCTDNAQACGPGVDPQPCTSELCTYTAMEASLNSAIAEMNSFSTSLSGQPNFADIVTGLQDGQNEIDSMPTLDVATIDSLQSSISDLIPETDTYVAEIETVESSLSSSLATLDLDGLSSQVESADGMLDSVAGDLDSYRTTLADLNGTASGGDIADLVSMVGDYVDAVHDLLFQDLDVLLDNFRGTAVAEAIQREGLAGGLLVVADTLDDIVEPFANVSEGEDYTAMRDLVVDNADMFTLIDVAADRDDDNLRFSRGAMFYLLSVFGALNGTVPDEIGLDVSVFEDLRVDEGSILGIEGRYNPETGVYDTGYADGVFCVTDECISNTVDMMFSKPIADVPLPLPAGTTISLLYALPGLFCLFVLLALGCATCGRKMTAPMTFCGCAMIPFLFLFAGAIGMPFLLVVSDFCDYMEPTALTIISSSEATLCETFGLNVTMDSAGIETYCSFEVDQDNILLFDLNEVTRSILLPCEGLSGANLDDDQDLQEPIAALWASVRNMSRPLLASNIKPLLESNETETQPRLDEAVEEILDQLADAIDGSLVDLSNRLGCEQLGFILETVKDPICCSLADSLFFLVIPWFCIALSIFGCIVPILCCTRDFKRRSLAKVFVNKNQ